MKFYRMRDMPIRHGDVVFRESWVNKFFGFVITLAMCGLPMAFAIHARSWWGGVFAAFFLLFPMLFWSPLRLAFGSANWLVRCRGEGLLIKFRSYQNAHFDDNEIAAFALRPDEIAWARRTRETICKPGSEHGHTTRETVTFIDIKPRNEDLAGLEVALKAEREHPTEGGWIKSKTNDDPVRVVEGGVIRIAWRGQSNWITPPADRALKAMAEVMRTEIRPDEVVFKDLASDPRDRAKSEQMILELAERGDTMAAIKLVRKHYGYSLTKAKRFVDELTGKAATAEREKIKKTNEIEEGAESRRL